MIRRKPSASHWVHRLPDDSYSPESCRFSFGTSETVDVSSKGIDGGAWTTRPSALTA